MKVFLMVIRVVTCLRIQYLCIGNNNVPTTKQKVKQVVTCLRIQYLCIGNNNFLDFVVWQ